MGDFRSSVPHRCSRGRERAGMAARCALVARSVAKVDSEIAVFLCPPLKPLLAHVHPTPMLLVLPALLVLLDWAAPCHARHGEHTVRIRTEGHRHTHPGNTHHYVRLQAIALERKYAPRTPTRDPARKSHRKRQVTAALSDDYQQGLDIEYTLPLGLGSSPAQQLVFDIDSGSSDTIVSAIACTGCSKAARFDPTRSNTYQELAETFTIACALIISVGQADES